MSILIRNGTIITNSGSRKSDILIRDGRISRIDSFIAGDGEKVIDAAGKYIMPGGIDPHVHMHLPVTGGFSSDDFYSGSRAALYGGTTTLLDFVTPHRGQSPTEALEQRMIEAADSLVDYSFHVSPVEWRDTTNDEIRRCIASGITSFKVYMAYKDTVGVNDADLYKVMESAGRAGGTVTVHCELGDEIGNLRNIAFYTGHTGPVNHSLTRPPHLEAQAVAKAINIASETGCSLYIVHVSARESLKHIRDAKARGQKVYAETCPQYLLLDDSKYQGDFNSAAPFIMSPPLRMKDDSEALWESISDGTIDTIGTDHCPFSFSQKEPGRNDFRQIPSGAGGVEHRLELLYTYGVLAGRITLPRMVDLLATRPARIFGLYPQKGDILAGADADLVIWNTDSQKTISSATHHQNCDINIYEGFTVRGYADYVITGGKIMIENGSMAKNDSRGSFIKREIY